MFLKIQKRPFISIIKFDKNFVDLQTVHTILVNEAQTKERESKPEPRQCFYSSFHDKLHFLSDCSHVKAKKVKVTIQRSNLISYHQKFV